ncbi:MAG TPA: sulfotransferase domain-containing protein [Phycisphaerae bacterium]|jgi:hypothetical protein|nr:sulfotransferase domain-containing protein [Phycisphaerae bacterium]HOJ53463.1 sulfotransferase domain-containing protein [Phycisphaerae bacterium]HOL25414.1 sulfotransferase domain-containing protein [Phycisphaerae bacterium]HPP19910.1 sulfotransferase domain-containing protein [Phycisphaerae bacterium]HPU31165.1 sulfotransferase domain-containing protein [Phycisphaerae bacterium]
MRLLKRLLGLSGNPTSQPEESRGRLPGRPRPVPAFVLACPRSGTTWLRRALNAHPEILCVERRLFGMYWDTVQDAGAARPRLRLTTDYYMSSLAPVVHGGDLPVNPEELAALMLSRFVATLDECLLDVSSKTLLVDKLTPYPGTAEAVAAGIQRCCPDAPIIQLIRDGRDVATSGVFHWLNKTTGEGDDPIRRQRVAYFVERRQGVQLERFFSDQDLSQWCDLWTTAIQVAKLLRPRHRILTVRYEDMIQDFPTVLAGLFSFLGVDASRDIVDHAVQNASFEKMSGGRRRGEEDPTAHVRKGVTGDWRNYFTRQDADVFCRLAGEELRAWGYEADDDWVKDVPAVLKLPNPHQG